MMDAKHAPGPWVADDGAIIADGAAIGTYHSCDDFPCYDEEEHDDPGCHRLADHCEANGRLMAAAPELLAACELALRACQENIAMACYKDERILLEAIDALRPAIAKAK